MNIAKCFLGFGLCLLISACSATKVAKQDTITFHPSKDFTTDADNIGLEEENVIGKAVAAKILGTYGALNKNTLNQYLNKVGRTVAAASSRPETFSGYSFAILSSSEVNAMAAPGGYIFITSGFLKLLPDEDALAAVLAHEVGHVIKRHGLKSIKPENYADFALVGGVLASSIDCTGLSQQVALAFAGAINDVYDALIKSGFSKEQEYEADSEAWQILKQAGYDPNSLKVVLNILAKRNNSGGWFKTHPKPSDRVLALKDLPQNESAASQAKSKRKKRFDSERTSQP